MYGKIFVSMYEGSLYGNWEAIVTFQQFICLANRDGVVDMTAAAIAGKTSIPLEIIQKGIVYLTEPDPQSRTPDCEGRRLETLDAHRAWGWRIVNYEQYRRMASMEDKLTADRERIHQKRLCEKVNKIQDVAECRKVSREVANVAQVEVEVEVKKKIHISPPRKLKQKTLKTPIPPDFTVSDAVKAWAEEHKHYHLDRRLAHFTDTALAKGYQYVDWDAAFRKAIREDWAKLGADPPPPTDPYANNPLGMYADWPSPPAEDFCIHGWGLTPELRVKHGDRADHECGQCQADARKAAESEVTA